MANKKHGEEGIRKITKLGKKSLAVTLPVDLVEKLHWREKQKVSVKKKGSKLVISDWRSKNPHASRQMTHNLRRRMGR
jgi:antitoxin component of MazEF toxin-antitoxin module